MADVNIKMAEMADVKKKLVSIIIPLYNGAKEIPETLHALGKQTYRDLEIFVVDDGSKDDPGEAVAAVGDPRVAYIRQDNQGPAAARNNGAGRCHGEYVMFLDHDDLLVPEAIAEAVHFLETHREFGVAYFDFLYYVNQKPRVYYRHRLARDWSGNVLDNLLRYGPMCNPSQAVIRRSAIDGLAFESALVGSDDWDYFIQIAHRGTRFAFIPKVLVYRELSQNSFTGGAAGRVKTKNSSIRLYEKWMKLLPREKVAALGLYDVLERILLKRIFVMIMDKQCSRREVKEEARKLLQTAQDSKLKFQLRCFLAVLSIAPRSLSRWVAAIIDNARIKHNFVAVSAPSLASSPAPQSPQLPQ